jgi:phosphoesterase RecJ-like protein
MPHRIAKQIYTKVMASSHLLLIPHQNPDGDALGSVTSFMKFLEKNHKPYTVFCQTGVSDKLIFLPGAERVSSDPAIWHTVPFDTIVVFDSGDLRYAGVADYIAALEKKPTLICFDHHATNEHYGDLNLVIPTASSTTEILYRFYTYNNVVIDRDIATCLLTGLVTDTDNFTNAGTSAGSLAIGGQLIKLGGDLNLIKDWVFKDKTVTTLKLWGKILSRLAHHEKHDVVYTYFTQDDLKEYDVSDTETEGIANFLNNLKDGRAALILKELPDGAGVKGSFRTTRNDTDVSKIAKKLGGGGHKKAAGFSLAHNIEDALEKIWETIEIHGLELEPVVAE